jgi:hypothetical protein
MYVNYQQVVARVLVHVTSKPNHGQRDLLVFIGKAIEAESMDEDAYNEFLARFGDEVAEVVANKLPSDHSLIRPDAAPSEPTQAVTHPIASSEGDPPCPSRTQSSAPSRSPVAA